jgi:hypothetical protein
VDGNKCFICTYQELLPAPKARVLPLKLVMKNRETQERCSNPRKDNGSQTFSAHGTIFVFIIFLLCL